MTPRQEVHRAGLQWETVSASTVDGWVNHLQHGRPFHLTRRCAERMGRFGTEPRQARSVSVTLARLEGMVTCQHCCSTDRVLEQARRQGVAVPALLGAGRTVVDCLELLGCGPVAGREAEVAVAVEMVGRSLPRLDGADPLAARATEESDAAARALEATRVARQGALVLWSLRHRYRARFRCAPVPAGSVVRVPVHRVDAEFLSWATTDPCAFRPSEGLEALVGHWDRSCGRPSGGTSLVHARPGPTWPWTGRTDVSGGDAARAARAEAALVGWFGSSGGLALLPTDAAELFALLADGCQWQVDHHLAGDELALELALELAGKGLEGRALVTAACVATGV